MSIWSSEIKELEKLYASFKGALPDLEKELEQLIKTDDPVVVLVYSRRSLELIVNELCETELNRPRKTEPLKGIIDKLNSENKVPEHIITTMLNLNSMSAYGAHPKDFEVEQVKPVLNNLHVVLKWYLKYRILLDTATQKPVHEKPEIREFSTKSNPEKRKLLLVLAISIVAITVLAFVLIKLVDKFKKDLDIASLEKSIAVLPFKSLSTDKEKQYQADGMMDAILLHLSKIKDLRVMSRTSVEQYRDTKKTMHDIGKELDVSFILEGTFQKEGDKVKLIVQLLTAENEAHVWANDYDRSWKDVFEVQSEVAQTIAGALNAVITISEKKIIEIKPTANLTAYDFYQRGEKEMENYYKNNNLKDLKKAENLFRKAISYDSTFAEPYVAWSLAYLEKHQWDTYFVNSYIDSLLILANKALSFNDKIAEAYYVKGLFYRLHGQYDEAMFNFNKSINLNPNYPEAYDGKGYIYIWIRRDYIKGIENYNKALSLIRGEGRPSLLRSLGFAYSDIGFIEKGKYCFNEAYTLDSNRLEYLDEKVRIEQYLGNFEASYKLAKLTCETDSTYLPHPVLYSIPGYKEDAFVLAKKWINRSAKSGDLNLLQYYRIGYAFWQVGRYKEAEFYFNKQIKIDEESIRLKRNVMQWKAAYYDLAATYAFLGDKVKAFHYLDEWNTLNVCPLWWICLAKNDPLFNSIRNEERFQKIIRNVESKYNAEHERVRKWLESQGKL